MFLTFDGYISSRNALLSGRWGILFGTDKPGCMMKPSVKSVVVTSPELAFHEKYKA